MTPWRRAYARGALGLLLPALSLLALFVVWPLARAFAWSLQDIELLAPERQRWVGLSHYSELLADARFSRAFRNTAVFALMVVPAQTAAAFGLALWVNRPEPHWRWLRAVFFTPTILSMPVLAVLWTLLYQPQQGAEMGLVNAVITAFGMSPQTWLGDPALALPALAFMSVWQGVGLQMLVFLAGLQLLSRDSLEAALLDGASGWQRTWHVTLPAMRNTIIFVVSVTTIFAFRLFVQPYLMTRGGPRDSTLSVIQAVYESTFIARELGRACAAMFLLLAFVLALTLLQRWFARERFE